ncbi:MAG: HupE/UreJ family protein [Notoacmeibacter sp.]
MIHRLTTFAFAVFVLSLAFAFPALAHAVAEGDKGFIQEITGVHFVSFMYLGAKHMITGYDHLLFLAGVIFFLYRMKDIGIYVTLFAIGHSVTMLAGVYYNIAISSYIIDAIIGFSVIYKALDNLGAWERWLGFQPNTKGATLFFGLLHGFGLASKVQDYGVSQDGLLTNLIAFNIGVEIGQLMALTLILIAMSAWRASPRFMSQAFTANMAMVVAGFMLMALHITGYLTA